MPGSAKSFQPFLSPDSPIGCRVGVLTQRFILDDNAGRPFVCEVVFSLHSRYLLVFDQLMEQMYPTLPCFALPSATFSLPGNPEKLIIN
jgi:hypothetical protein